jgi:cytosine/adenosine deaminase-related metal-dependent hydrolase
MGYRKFKADFIFDGNSLLSSNHILITDNEGIIKDIVTVEEAGDTIETFSGIISPGFINCHCHLELSCMKNAIETGTGLVDFLITVISKRGKPQEEIQDAMIAADKEMYDKGIIAVGDICNTTNSVQAKLQSKICYHNFIEVLGFTEERAAIVLQTYLDVFKAFSEAGLTANTSIVPHAPYTISAAVFGLINNVSAGKIISIHNQENLAENKLYQSKTGDFLRLYQHLNINTDFFRSYNKSSIQSYLPLLDKPETILLVHNSFTMPADIDFVAGQSNLTQQQFFWCLCPNANLYIENKLPPVETFVQKHCSLVLGTDSYSSNHSLDILDEIKTLQKHFPSLKTGQLLSWATLNGAKALGKQDSLGSFEKGKKPGIVLINAITGSAITPLSSAKRII